MTIKVRGGDGGAGVSSFMRRKGLPKGKPNGGAGGSGGDATLVADSSVPTLLRYERHPVWKAPSGTHGEGDFRHGRRGENLVLHVPLATIVKDSNAILCSALVLAGLRVRPCWGGHGTRGHARLCRSRV